MKQIPKGDNDRIKYKLACIDYEHTTHQRSFHLFHHPIGTRSDQNGLPSVSCSIAKCFQRLYVDSSSHSFCNVCAVIRNTPMPHLGIRDVALATTPARRLTHAPVISSHRLMQKQNQDVGRKLGTATACMFTLPIIAFYFGLNVLFTEKEHPDNWAGGLAILVTNIVVFGYCYSAFQEPDDEPENDEDGPRVGIFKKRTD